MKTLYYFPFLLLFFFQTSCSTTSDDSNIEPDSTSESTQEVNRFPEDSDANQLSVLKVANYHVDEIDPSIRNKKWMELIKIGNTYALVNSSILLSRVHDEILDEEFEMTGWEVYTAHADKSVLLIEKYPFLKENQVNHVATDVEMGFNKEKTYTYNNVKYRLYSKGNQENETNFQLFVEAEKNGKKITTLLVSIPQMQDKQTMIYFIGDIDNDGRLDFIIDSSNHYNVQTMTLYLSQPTDAESLCIPVGQITSVGC